MIRDVLERRAGKERNRSVWRRKCRGRWRGTVFLPFSSIPLPPA
jgi:hypothetical protein